MDIINPGEISDPITVIKNITVKNGRGMTNLAGTEIFCETLARVRPGRAVNHYENGKLVVIQPYKVAIYYDPDKVIAADMLIKFNGGTYAINSITGLDSRMMFFHFTITKST